VRRASGAHGSRFQKLLEIRIGHAVALHRQVLFYVTRVGRVLRTIDEKKVRRFAGHQSGYLGPIR
jgi:hypothetical protein